MNNPSPRQRWNARQLKELRTKARARARRRPEARSNVKPSRHASLKIGWVALAPPLALCDGDACVVGGDRQTIDTMLQRSDPADWKIFETTYAEIERGLELGAAYALDEVAYDRFYPLAQAAGYPVSPQDFSDPGPTGIHLVRIQLFLPGGWGS